MAIRPTNDRPAPVKFNRPCAEQVFHGGIFACLTIFWSSVVLLIWGADWLWRELGVSRPGLTFVAVILFFTISCSSRKIAYLIDTCQHGKGRDGSGVRRCSRCNDALAAYEAERQRSIRADAERRARDDEERARRIAAQRAEMAREVRTLSYLKSVTPIRFEEIIHEAYRRLGWNVKATPASGDNGVDGFLRKGKESVVLQCKRFTKGALGEPQLRDLLGTMVREEASRGILITTSSFTERARKWAGDVPLSLIDGNALVQLMREAFPDGSVVPAHFVDIGPPNSPRYEQCPKCGRKTVPRKGRNGKFLGCSGYPACRWTRNWVKN